MSKINKQRQKDQRRKSISFNNEQQIKLNKHNQQSKRASYLKQQQIQENTFKYELPHTSNCPYYQLYTNPQVVQYNQLLKLTYIYIYIHSYIHIHSQHSFIIILSIHQSSQLPTNKNNQSMYLFYL
ncbi:hypothetical protein ABPG74_019053 [Tetrahymena malaccensis]